MDTSSSSPQVNKNKNSGVIGNIYSPGNEGTSKNGISKSYTTRRPRQRSTVLVRARKILIMEFQNLSLNRPEEYGKPGEETWMLKLLEYMQSKDKEVQVNDIHRWSRTHPWILNPSTSTPPFMDHEFYDIGRGNYGEPPTQSSVSVQSTTNNATNYSLQVSSSTSSTAFTNRQSTNNNVGTYNNNQQQQQQPVYGQSYNTSSTTNNLLPVSTSTSSNYTKYEYNVSQDVIGAVKYETIPYAVTTTSTTVENLLPTPPSTRTSVNTPVSFPSYDDITTEINYHAIPSFPATISSVMDTVPVSTSNNNNNVQYNSQMLSMEEKDIKYGNAFCAIAELYRICSSMDDLHSALRPIQEVHKILTGSYTAFRDINDCGPQHTQL